MGVHTFPKGICQKVNVVASLEFELASNDSTEHRSNHYTTRTPTLVQNIQFFNIKNETFNVGRLFN